MDASENNHVNQETDKLLPTHVPWNHSNVKNRCINVTVGLSDYDDDKLLYLWCNSNIKARLGFAYGPHPHYKYMQNSHSTKKLTHLGLW